MGNTLGVLAALTALVCWGVGDFLIQRATRKVGVVATLLSDAMVGAALLLPFAASHFGSIVSRDAGPIILGALALGLIAAPINFVAFQKGKLSVVSPIFTLELFITILLGAIFLSERLTAPQLVLVGTVFVGVVLASVHHRERGTKFEAGALLAFAGAVGLGLANILNGSAARVAGPIPSVWGIRFGFVVCLGAWLLLRGQMGMTFRSIRKNSKLMLSAGAIDTLAWLAYAYAVTQLPIGLAVAIAQGYVALSVLLGVLVNRERLRPHQAVGVIVAIGSSIALAALSA